MNVDPKEINKFSDLASRWWDTSGEFKPLHIINPVRMAYIQEHTTLESKHILDIGCGGGILSESLAQSGAHVTGIDLSEKALSVAKLHLHESKLAINYQYTSAEDFAQKHASQFDIITCMEMLEHVPDPTSIIQACYTLLKPGGSLFLSTLNRTPTSYLKAILGAEYIMQLLPKGTHQYNRFIKPKELLAACRETHFIPNDIKGYTLNPLTWQARLCTSTAVNYIAHCLKPC
jgi:2-polyprenyl-6-hydroxyphenyl methylase/3-demethylubiquinone-9 3-methyltransferase